MNSFSLIQQRYSSMSPVEKRIADCILEDPEHITKSTIVYLARKANVSQGSVSNFAVSLGFPGFSQLKINLAQNLPAAGETADSRADTAAGKRTMRDLIESSRASFESTLDTVPAANFNEAAQILSEADHIILTGFAHSAPVAQDIAFRLMSLGLPAQVITDALVAHVACANLGEKGVLFAISHSGRTRDTVTCARIARQAGAKVICFTSYARNELSQLSDITFVSVSNEAQYYRESMTARLTQLIMGDCLVEMIAERIGPRAVERLDAIVDIFERNREALASDLL